MLYYYIIIAMVFTITNISMIIIIVLTINIINIISIIFYLVYHNDCNVVVIVTGPCPFSTK
jgi:hypothetical protein